MKNIFPVFLLSLYLLAFTEFSQLLKITVLVEHFIEHKQNNGTGFLKFIAEHYVYGDGDESDNDKDNKLPFKSHNSVLNTAVAEMIPVDHSLSPLPSLVSTEIFFPEKRMGSSEFPNAIWQPPRFS
jgi:hypothetical protein